MLKSFLITLALLFIICSGNAELPKTKGKLIYTFQKSSPLHASPFVTEDGKYIYYTSIEPDNLLGKIDAVTGNSIWEKSFSGDRLGMRDSLLVAQDMIHVGNDNGTYSAYNAADGSLLWQYFAVQSICYSGARKRPCEAYSSPTLDEGGSVRFQGYENNRVFAFNAKTGEVLWTVVMNGNVDGTPALDPYDGHVLIGANDGYFYKLNKDSGAVIWKFQHCGHMQNKPSVMSPLGTVLFTCFTPGQTTSVGYVYSVDLKTGQAHWQIPGAGGVPTGVPTRNLAYVAGYDGAISCLNATTGTTIWKNKYLPSAAQFMSPLVYNPKTNRVYGGNMDGYFVALDADTGEIVWDYNSEKTIANPLGPRLSPDGNTVYFSNYAGSFFAFAA